MAGIVTRIRFSSVMYSCLAGVVASRAQWRLGIFAVGLQMAIKLNQVKSILARRWPGGFMGLFTFFSINNQHAGLLNSFACLVNQTNGYIESQDYLGTTFPK